ncbi:hypothetical protein SUGI_0716010 [Cryptomeria japonica]|nr:hypothetical protein SUGI_0716010 [Cryptomeria japonica]
MSFLSQEKADICAPVGGVWPGVSGFNEICEAALVLPDSNSLTKITIQTDALGTHPSYSPAWLSTPLLTARGILYLHDECTDPILHCDIKPQNILLDENYRAKIADFGISKSIGEEKTRTFTAARGTVGYIAPEWNKSMAVTVKVDAYSFGVMLMEIICCRKVFELHGPENEMILSEWVYDCFKCGKLERLTEHQQCRDIDKTELERMVLVGLSCIQEDYSLRPSMKKSSSDA